MYRTIKHCIQSNAVYINAILPYAIYWIVFCITLFYSVSSVHEKLEIQNSLNHQIPCSSVMVLNGPNPRITMDLKSDVKPRTANVLFEIEKMGQIVLNGLSCNEKYELFPGDCESKFSNGTKFICYLSHNGFQVYTHSMHSEQINLALRDEDVFYYLMDSLISGPVSPDPHVQIVRSDLLWNIRKLSFITSLLLAYFYFFFMVSLILRRKKQPHLCCESKKHGDENINNGTKCDATSS
jgi:hypothetical protein